MLPVALIASSCQPQANAFQIPVSSASSTNQCQRRKLSTLVTLQQSSDPYSDESFEYPQEQQQGDEGLILSDAELEQQMARLRSKYPTSEADYLAAARARSAAKVPSNNSQASDEDWKKARDQAQAQGAAFDDWENSLSEAGNVDSQILIPIDDAMEGDDNEDGGEPKLMLF